MKMEFIYENNVDVLMLILISTTLINFCFYAAGFLRLILLKRINRLRNLFGICYDILFGSEFEGFVMISFNKENLIRLKNNESLEVKVDRSQISRFHSYKLIRMVSDAYCGDDQLQERNLDYLVKKELDSINLKVKKD